MENNTTLFEINNILRINACDIISAWADINLDPMVSIKSLSQTYSATVPEISLFLKTELGDQYKDIVKLKRQIFFSKVGKSRRIDHTVETTSRDYLEEIEMAKARLTAMTRYMSDFSADELEKISDRLRSRMKGKIFKKKAKKTCR